MYTHSIYSMYPHQVELYIYIFFVGLFTYLLPHTVICITRARVWSCDMVEHERDIYINVISALYVMRARIFWPKHCEICFEVDCLECIYSPIMSSESSLREPIPFTS